MKIRVNQYIILFFVFCNFNLAKAQNSAMRIIQLDSKIEQVQVFLDMENWQTAIDSAVNYQQICEDLSYAQGKGRCLGYLAKAYQGLNNQHTGLKYYLYAEMVFVSQNLSTDLIDLYIDLGRFYMNQGLFTIAKQYLLKSEALLSQTETRKLIAYCYQQLGMYDEAIQIYSHILNNQMDISFLESTFIQKKIFDLNVSSNKFKAAKQVGIDLEKSLLVAEVDTRSMFEFYNNMGFVYKELNQNKQSLNYFEKANKLLFNNKTISTSEQNQADLYINLGTVNSSENEYSKAKDYFQKALSIYARLGIKKEIGICNNFIAANYYLSGSNPQALKYANQAEAIGLQLNDNSILATSYQILNKINLSEKFTEKAESYAIKAKKVRNQILMDDKNKYQQQSIFEKAAIAKEMELKNTNINSEEEKRKLKDYKIDSEKREKILELKAKELELNKSDLENQRLEKERIAQLLTLSNQKQKVAELQKEREIQQLLITQKEGNEKQRVQEIKLLEKEQKIQFQKLQEAKRFRQLGVLIFILVGIILVIVLFSLLIVIRSKKQVQIQNLHIVKQTNELQFTNKELEHKQEEVILQNVLLEESNKKLHSQNNIITSSIGAASIIQGAVLPTMEKLSQIFPDFFIFFKPRDIVSGDFYWIEEIDNLLFIIEADCTGHGVPGAFMSMIGKTLLDNIILVKHIYEPQKILIALHNEIRIALHQDSSGNNDGMDMAVVQIKQGKAKDQISLSYCGAKSPVYLKNLKTNEFSVLKESRKSIGGITANHLEFEAHELELVDDTMLYLFSDGYIDQNDKNRKRLGSDIFKKMINTNANLSCKAQRESVKQKLEEQIDGTSQRDDILVIGLKLSPKNFQTH